VEERERALRLVKRGDEQLAEGGIAQARLLYERAAEAGLAQGAMALAATYDPDELARLGVVGIQPDRATAARWYERARALGATEAAQRLQRLGAR
jgi:TPR repeat protein